MNEELILHVGHSGDEEYSTIAAAIEAASNLFSNKTNDANIVIEVDPGTYHERLEVHTPYLTIRGVSQNAADVVITHGDYARAIHADGEEYGTFRTATLFINAPHVTLQNLTVENSAGSGVNVGQALALYADGDCLFFNNCRLLGEQDTLFTAPLPPYELQKHGFRGPKEFAPRTDQRHFYKDCYIAGNVDFIFGSASAYFENCEIFSCFKAGKTGGYVTAPSTPEGKKYGYIFNKCRFTSACLPDTVYLGRPWRDFGKVVIINSYLGEHIRKEGWHDWNKPQSHTTTFFAEYNNNGPGADISQRVSFAHILTADEAAEYDFSAQGNVTKEAIFKQLWS